MKSKKIMHKRRKKKISIQRQFNKTRIKKNKSLYNVYAPEIFKVRTSPERLIFINFINKVESILHSGRSVRLHLEDVEELHPCGTLIFLAKLEIWLASKPEAIVGTYPKDNIAEQLLQNVGALNLLGLPPRQEITSEKVLPWHFHSGRKVAANAYESLTLSVLGNDLNHPEKQLFADCLNEAVDNIVGHAYAFNVYHTPQPVLQKWWIFSLSEKDRVFVSIFDSGVTIPRSLRKKDGWASYISARTYLSDSRLIKLASTTKETSTKLPNRGKGLPEMVEFSKNLSSGGLTIFSGRAAFSYNAEKDRLQNRPLDCYLPGTLVLWHLPFQKERRND